MTDANDDDADLETLHAIAEGQGIDYRGMSRAELVEALREAGVGQGGGNAEERLDPDEGGRPSGEYGNEGVGYRESPGGPAAEASAEPES